MKYVVDDTSLISIADAIRAKTGKTEELTLAEMPTEIGNIEAGGGSNQDLIDGRLTGTWTSIDSDVTKVIDHACRNLTSLKTVNLPKCTNIGLYAFYGCSTLHTLNAPLCTNVSAYAFQNCYELLNLNLPKVVSILIGCFQNNYALQKADFEVAKSIAANSFASCRSLTALILRKSDAICTLANTSAFTGTPIADGTGYIYVPRALIASYQTATNWSNFSTQFRALEDYTVDGTITGELDLTKI